MYLIFALLFITLLLGVSQLNIFKTRNSKVIRNVPKVYFILAIFFSALCSDFFMGFFMFISILMPIVIWNIIFKPYGKNFFRKDIKRSFLIFFLIPAIIITGAVSLNKIVMSKWIANDSVLGKWSSTVKYNSPDLIKTYSVLSEISISDDNSVVGKIGEGKFSKCNIRLNRNLFEKMIMVKTDYIVEGYVKGKIVVGDEYEEMKITIPFNSEDGIIKGSIFYIKDMEYPYPIVTRMEMKKTWSN